jgi:hypothetical protein
MAERVVVAGLVLGVLGLVGACEGDERAGSGPKREVAEVAGAAGVDEPKSQPEVAPMPGEAPIPVTLPGGSGAGRAGGSPTADDVASPAPGESLQDCLGRCASAALSEDNRATCRLLCESHHREGQASPDAAAVDGYFGCFDQCAGEAACHARCAVSVAGKRGCVQRCLEGLGRCLAPCESSGEEGRCAERCETAARACVARC